MPTGSSDRSTSGLVGLVVVGLRPYLTGETARRLLETVDLDALLDGRTIDDALEREHAGAILGQALGGALAEERRGNGHVHRLAVRVAGERVGAHLGRAATATLVEYGLLATVLDDLRELTTDPGVHRLLDELEATATPADSAGVSDPAERTENATESHSTGSSDSEPGRTRILSDSRDVDAGSPGSSPENGRSDRSERPF